MTTRSRSLYKLSIIAMSVAAITVCSWIYIPLPVGFTLQIFAIFLISGCFSLEISLSATLIYLSLGIMGVPVFSGFGAGFSALMGASGGYLIAFPFACLVISLPQRKYADSPFLYTLTMSLALIVCYVLGCVWYMYVFSYPSSASLWAALSVTVLPFIIADALKILLAALICKRLRSYLKRFQL